MKKEVRICHCGRLHFIDFDIIDAALNADKDVLLICGICGKATMIGADRMPDYWTDSDKEVFNMYAYNAGDEDFTLDASKFENTNSTKGIFKVVYSVGKGVPMMTGSHAGIYTFGRFEDIWYPDFYKIEHPDVTLQDVHDFIDKWRRNRTTVNMNRLINSLTDDEAELLSRLYIEGLDWKGTKYERKY